MTPRWMVCGFLALAAATTWGVFDADGHRVGVVREGPGARLDLFDAESNRTGWGRKNADGSAELFAPNGQRLGTVSKDGAIRLQQPLKEGGGKR